MGRSSPICAAIESAQKLLDRILFIAFAQRTDLLPDRLLERAVKATNEFDPQPIWSNFRVCSAWSIDGHYDAATSRLQWRLFARRSGGRCARAAGPAGRRSRRARRMGLSQRRAGHGARPYFRAVDHRPRKAARREPRRGAAEGLASASAKASSTRPTSSRASWSSAPSA